MMAAAIFLLLVLADFSLADTPQDRISGRMYVRFLSLIHIFECFEQIQFGVFFDFNAQVVELLNRSVASQEI